jgi:hypothetical protein
MNDPECTCDFQRPAPWLSESDAADCEYEHRTVLDDIVDAID